MNEIIERWRRAAQRADIEKVRVIKVGEDFLATSTSTPLHSYALRRTNGKWSCECVANTEHGLPCKHLAALASIFQLDVLFDVRLSLPSEEAVEAA